MIRKNTYWLGLLSFNLFLLLNISSNGQGGAWTWMRGSQGPNPVPVYGTQGVASPRNEPQGFYEAANWIDQQGNFWVFGGVDSAGNTGYSVTGDMWKYDPVNNEWTWMKGPGLPDLAGIYGTLGVPSPANTPGCRGWGCLSWTDNNGNLWLFGGNGHDVSGSSGNLNDLWKYDIAKNEWTWMNGSEYINMPDVYGTYQQPSASNTPGARQENCTAWVDNNNNLWFFGGMGVSGSFYNDMWKYNISTNEWAWMKGVKGENILSSYGTLGVEDSSNLPPARGTYTRWRDAEGNFYIFGGIKNFFPELFDDVWKYNTINNNWTWVAGDSVINSAGNYSQYCTDNGKTGPMGRGENRTAQSISCATAFLTFGGFVTASDGSTPGMNDLWLFDTKTNDWKWVSGSDTFNSLGYYGTKGIGSVINTPPALYGPCMWVDKSGTFWLFAGQDVNSKLYNAVWKFVPDTSCIPVPLAPGITAQLSQPSICPGDTSLLTITGTSNPVISPLTDVTWLDPVHAYLYPDTSTTYKVSDNSPCSATDLANVNLNVLKPAIMNYVLPDSQICLGDSVLLTVINGSGIRISPATGLNWQDSSQVFLSPDTTTIYTIKGKSTCLGSKTLLTTVHVSAPKVQISSDTNRICQGNSVQICATAGLSSYLWNNGKTGMCIYAGQQGKYYVTARDPFNCPATSNNITLSVLPVPPISISLSKPDICRGDSAMLNLTGTPAAVISPLTGVAWKDSVHAFLFPDTNTTYIISNKLPCSVDSSVTLLVTKPAVMNYVLGDSIICMGDSTTLSIMNGVNIRISPSSGVRWKDSTDAVLSPNSTTSYTITGQSTCASNKITALLNVDNPQVIITGDTAPICPGNTAQLCANRGFAAYVWNTGDSGLCIYTAEAGLYFVNVRDLNNCPAASNSLPVSIKVAPSISIEVVGDSFNVYNGQVVQWYRNGDPIPGATGQTYVASEPGDYTVAVIDPDGCRSTSGEILLSATGVTNFEENNITIYPNPSSGIWNLEVGDSWMGGILNIYDAEGRLVYSVEVHYLKSEIRLNVEPGIYLMRLSAGDNSFVKKLIKM